MRLRTKVLIAGIVLSSFIVGAMVEAGLVMLFIQCVL